jgi:phage FluMu protein Com
MPSGTDSPRRRAEPPCDHGDDPARPDGDLVRCDCGSLLARYVGGRIELKCRRCKRIITVAIESAIESAVESAAEDSTR